MSIHAYVALDGNFALVQQRNHVGLDAATPKWQFAEMDLGLYKLIVNVTSTVIRGGVHSGDFLQLRFYAIRSTVMLTFATKTR